jgi:hypothetical protein
MSVCDQIFEILLPHSAAPAQLFTLDVAKDVEVTKHLLIYGAESVVNSAICLTRHTDYLSSTTHRLVGATATGRGILYRLQGGVSTRAVPSARRGRFGCLVT